MATTLSTDISALQDQICILNQAIKLLTQCMISEDDGDETARKSEEELELIQKEWKLEEVGFSRLQNTCNQLKENLRLAALEADQSVSDVIEIQKDLEQERCRSARTKRVVKKLYKENEELTKENESLKAELKRYKKEKKSIIKSLRGYLYSEKKQRKIDKEQNRSVPTNEREDYHEAPHSPLPTIYSDSIDDIVTPVSLLKVFEEDRPSTPCNEKAYKKISPLTIPTNVPNTPNSVSSFSTIGSHEGRATLRLTKCEEKDKEGAKSSALSFLKNFKNVIQSVTNTYVLEFTTQNPGIQFMRLPPNSLVDADMNPCLPIFLVVGFYGYRDTPLQRAPTFGARLIAIDSIDLETTEWSMTDLVGYIQNHKRVLKMTFRNDEVNKQNMLRLKEREKELAAKCKSR
ncbi:predicted protein [Chaetoceros tenuissimus]|uniref:Uncharacterized protein n=1 Tax=Chaetoceros tenuissimus TaxID=426638 RepID=A0AAD3HBC4_9STRA|nr:predicted protein [Chaetoceros tenuissimus]